jgi:hypothetical protein
MKLGLGLLILPLIIGHWSLNIAAVFLVLEMRVFGVFLAQRATEKVDDEDDFVAAQRAAVM